MKIKLFRQIFEKSSNIKFRENPSCGSRVVPCGQRDRRTNGQTDMTEVVVAFRNFANAPNTCAATNKVIKQRAKIICKYFIPCTTTTTLNVLICSSFLLYVTLASLKKLHYCDLSSSSIQSHDARWTAGAISAVDCKQTSSIEDWNSPASRGLHWIATR
jgi:hypothetical protein